jgi:D-arabinose 1-dehydrogenase-like Zn-dependent alcohol dehydrogenase
MRYNPAPSACIQSRESTQGKDLMPKMKIAVVPKPGADFEIQEREIPQPPAGHVRIKVQGCGICFSDEITKNGLFPGIAYPRAPGHEVAGVVDETGAGVTVWKKGQRVGVGWNAGHDGTCDSCRRGDFALCVNGKISGVSFDGGYAEYMIAPAEALARIPESLNAVDAAPLLCAGITTFNALRNSGARPGDLVAVLGIGGLGHLGLQFANKFGYQVVAISRGKENVELAKKLGAHIYIDSTATDAAAELTKLGGARAILATVPSSKAMSSIIGGLGPNGKLLVVGADMESIAAPTPKILFARNSVQGWNSGSSIDSEDTLRFADYSGVRPMIEKYPLDKVNEAFARMASGKAQFRVVLTM